MHITEYDVFARMGRPVCKGTFSTISTKDDGLTRAIFVDSMLKVPKAVARALCVS